MKKLILLGVALLSALLVLIGYNYLHQETAPARSLDDQMIAFLQEYVQINTAHPKPAYDQAHKFLIEHAQRDGFAAQRVHLPSGRAVVVITFQGLDSTLPSLVLNHHI